MSKSVDEFKEITLDSCPHCNEEIELKCRSILGEKVLVNQFYKYFNWHLKNECFSKSKRKIKKIKVTLKSKEGHFTTYTGLDLFI